MDGDEFAFKTFVDARRKISDQGKKELFEAVCFKLIEQKDYQGRLYSAIPDIAEHLDIFAEQLQEKGLLQSENITPGDCDGNASLTNSQVEDEIDLLGGEETETNQFSDMASALQTTDIKLGKFAKQLLDEQKAIKNEMKSNRYLVNTLAKVSKMLWNVEISGLNDSTVTDGAQAQIEAIRERIDRIEMWLKKN